MVSSITTLNPSVYAPAFEHKIGGAGKLYVPVSPSQVVHAQFDHVAGIPASNGEGVSISRIQILNTLLDQMVNANAFPELKLLGPNAESPAGSLFSILA
jgi:hypothetical protein